MWLGRLLVLKIRNACIIETPTLGRRSTDPQTVSQCPQYRLLQLSLYATRSRSLHIVLEGILHASRFKNMCCIACDACLLIRIRPTIARPNLEPQVPQNRTLRGSQICRISVRASSVSKSCCSRAHFEGSSVSFFVTHFLSPQHQTIDIQTTLTTTSNPFPSPPSYLKLHMPSLSLFQNAPVAECMPLLPITLSAPFSSSPPCLRCSP